PIDNPLREKHPAAPYALINPAAPTASSQGWTRPSALPQEASSGRSRPSGLQKDALEIPSALPKASAERSEALMREGGPIPQCQHLRLSGQQCGSPALRGLKFCYFHDYVRNPYSAGSGVPMPEDAAAIQIGLGRVIRCLE